ncbi:hypothetical protein [Mycolicibacterium houstonense]|uniref:hypothetical protein n=1 Tax=Mycolicibacterium houstonense TaxID=146021 RepID=UPI003F951114
MDNAATAGVLDFEVYLLMTMKYGMINRDAVREAKLTEHGLSLSDAESIHQRVAELLCNESTQFENLRALVEPATSDSGSLTFRGILWPEFDFTATANDDGSLRSAGYRRGRGKPQVADDPTRQPAWSMDATDFAHYFGPLTVKSTAALFDTYLPAQELHEFEWNGREYGAGFGWGLFLSASLIWT